MIRPGPLGPTDLRQLGFSEHLVVWTFRAFASGRLDCPMVVGAWREGGTGAAGEEAWRLMTIFAREVGTGGRREIVIGTPGLLMVTRDEQLLLALLSAASREDESRMAAHLRNDNVLISSLVRWLMAAAPSPQLLASGLAAGAALKATGYWLPPGEAEALDPRTARGLRAVG